MNNRILLVDDDIDILSTYQRTLRNLFVIKTAATAEEAINIVRSEPPFAVVVSDFSMPKVNGIQLLSHIQNMSPDTLRILISGFADMKVAKAAINDANIFRFLTKPILSEQLITVLNESIHHFDSLATEKDVLNRTVKGIMKILIDILANINPIAMKQAVQIRTVANDIAVQMQLRNTWEVEISALVSQIGCLNMSPELTNKLYHGMLTNDADKKLIEGFPERGKQMIQNIPTLTNVATAIGFQLYSYDGTYPKNSEVTGENLPITSRILKVAFDFCRQKLLGKTPAMIINEMRVNSYLYDPKVFTALMTINKMTSGNFVIRAIPFKALRIGMVLAEPMRDDEQFILVAKGQEITDTLLLRLINVAKIKNIIEPIRVIEKIKPDD